MINITSLSGKTYYLNCDLIYKIEQVPDTIITLVDGKTLVVKEEAEEVIEKIILYKRKIYSNLLEVVK